VKSASSLQNRRDASNVVRAARKIAEIMILQNFSGQSLKGGIGLGFVPVDRGNPTMLRGKDRLVIPVGALYKADGQRKSVVP